MTTKKAVKDRRRRLREQIYARDRGRCRYCNRRVRWSRGTVDHVLPKSRGGGDEPENLVWCCVTCNTYKGDRTPAEARMTLLPLEGDTQLTLTDTQARVIFDRYALYGEKSWSEVAARVASAIALAEKSDQEQMHWSKKFFEVMEPFDFVPGGRILAGAGGAEKLTFYNCYVIPSPDDSREGIMKSVTTMIEIMSRGGGVGVNLSTLRPRGASVEGVKGTSSGPVVWAEIYSVGTGSVIQGGSRRGALMVMLNDWHPDVIEFINAKKDMTKLTNANISVCVSDDFMQALKDDADWNLRFPDTKHPAYDREWDGDIKEWEAKGYPVIVYQTVKASEIWDMICESAWASGEPGLFFIERANKESNLWYYEKQIATNPCGEQPLGPWAVCNLGAINLANFVTEEGAFDLDRLYDVTCIATRFLDNVIDLSAYWIPENEAAQKAIRRIGLGTMGLADALIKMGVRYGSPESVEITEEIFRTIRDAAYWTSSQLAKERGAFPAYDRDKFLQGKFIQTLPDTILNSIKNHGLRNGFLLTQAPTGSTSMAAGVSSGIEPVFAFEYIRRDRIGETVIRHPLVEDWMAKNPGKELPDYFVTASELSPEEHLHIQATVQKYIDSSISKTMNAPNDHKLEAVKELYTKAYDMGCKGLTYYRDGSRNEQVLYHTGGSDTGGTGGTGDVSEEVAAGSEDHAGAGLPGQRDGGSKRPFQRDFSLAGRTYRANTPLGTAFVTVNKDNQGDPVEVFVQVGKAGSDVQAFTEAIARLISLSLQNGVAMERIISQLAGIGGYNTTGFGQNRVLSVPDAIGKVLIADLHEPAETVTEDHTEPARLEVATASGLLCPECGAGMAREEGCIKCYSCGYSEC